MGQLSDFIEQRCICRRALGAHTAGKIPEAAFPYLLIFPCIDIPDDECFLPMPIAMAVLADGRAVIIQRWNIHVICQFNEIPLLRVLQSSSEFTAVPVVSTMNT